LTKNSKNVIIGGMKNRYVIYLDEFVEELFEKMELLSEEGQGHQLVITAESREEGARELSQMLIPTLAKWMAE